MARLYAQRLTRRKVINYTKSKLVVHPPSICSYVLQYDHDLDQHHINLFHGSKFAAQPSFFVRSGHDIGSSLCNAQDRGSLKKTGNTEYSCLYLLEIK